MLQKCTDYLRSVPASVRNLAVILAVLGSASLAMAQTAYEPVAVDVPELIDFSALAVTMLGILGLAFATVAGVGLALAVGRRIVGWFKGA